MPLDKGKCEELIKKTISSKTLHEAENFEPPHQGCTVESQYSGFYLAKYFPHHFHKMTLCDINCLELCFPDPRLRP